MVYCWCEIAAMQSLLLAKTLNHFYQVLRVFLIFKSRVVLKQFFNSIKKCSSIRARFVGALCSFYRFSTSVWLFTLARLCTNHVGHSIHWHQWAVFGAFRMSAFGQPKRTLLCFVKQLTRGRDVKGLSNIRWLESPCWSLLFTKWLQSLPFLRPPPPPPPTPPLPTPAQSQDLGPPFVPLPLPGRGQTGSHIQVEFWSLRLWNWNRWVYRVQNLCL